MVNNVSLCIYIELINIHKLNNIMIICTCVNNVVT